MKIFCLTFLALFSCAIVGCKNNNHGKVVVINDSATIEKTYSEKGILVLEEFKFRDPNVPLLTKVYNPDGGIEKVYQSVKGQMEGFVHGHYANSVLMYEGQNKNDLRQGVWKWYYDDGMLKHRVNWKEGKKFGDALFYYNSGGIELYNFNGKEGHAVYVREYDTTGHLINEDGFPIQIFYNGISYKTPEDFEISIMLGLLPGWKAKIVVADISKRKRSVIAELKEHELKQGEYSKVAEITDLIDRPGRYLWEVHAVITDEFGRNIHATDTIPLDVPKSKFKDGR